MTAIRHCTLRSTEDRALTPTFEYKSLGVRFTAFVYSVLPNKVTLPCMNIAVLRILFFVLFPGTYDLSLGILICVIFQAC